MTDRSFINKAITTFSSGTFISRIIGLVRDIVLASFFHSSITDIWITAFRVPNLLRRILAEGTVTMSIVPILSDYKNEKKQDIVSSIFSVFFIILLITTILGIIFTPNILDIMVPAFKKTAGKFELTIELTKIMFPYIILIGITSYFMGILNESGYFFVSSVHPSLLSASIILFALISKLFNPEISAIAYAVVIGGFLQILIHIPTLKRKKLLPKLTTNLQKDAIRKFFKLFLPSMISVSVVPISVVINTYFASNIGSGNVSYLFWADRLVQVPLGVFAVSLGTAILPILSSNKEKDKFATNYLYVFKLNLLILLTSTVAFIALSTPIVKIIFQHGKFTWLDTVNTSLTLKYLALSLVPAGIIRISVPLFYALKDAKAPALISLISLLFNIIFCIILIPKIGISGLALAITGSSFINSFFLMIYFSKKYVKLKMPNLKFLIKTILIAASTYIASSSILILSNWNNSFGLFKDLLIVISAIITGGIIFILTSYLLKIRQELRSN